MRKPSWVQRLITEQDGFTVVEIIVTVAVGALVMTAIFPLFLLMNRVEETWRANSQSRAVGLVAESVVARDLRSYCFVNADANLILQGVANTGEAFRITYWIDGADSNLPRLVREVSPPTGGQPERSTVAHGILNLTAEKEGSQVRVSMTVAGTGSDSVKVKPDLVITQRNKC